ncbi:MAG: glycosyltransferase family 1 protein [Proteobacteria bacterium]|nr:glycosyltransferase family 1 protein [Pseudomonadota bacterium]
MRIGIDSRFVTRQPLRGIGNYSLNLIKELVSLDSTTEFFLYIADPDVDNLLPVAPNVTVRLISPSLYPIWEQICLPYVAARDNLDVLHCMGMTGPLLLSAKIKLVVSLHDVMFMKNSEVLPKPKSMYQKFGQLYRRVCVPKLVRRAQAVITISEFSRNDIIQSMSFLDEKKIVVTYVCCDPIFSVPQLDQASALIRDVVSEPFIFCLGATDPRKNTLRVVRSFLSLIEHHQIRQNLVVAGMANWQSSDEYKLVMEARAECRVKFVGFVDNNDLAALYQSAAMFVFPSVYEGFGIPVLEAFLSRCPLVASNLTSIPEIGAEAGLYFDPSNEADIEASMLQLLSDDDLRQSMIELGSIRFKDFSWALTAQSTSAVYQNVISDGSV